jgi:hypothetical protein
MFSVDTLHGSNITSSKGINMRPFVAIALLSTFVLQVTPLMAAPAIHDARARAQAPAVPGAINGTARTAAGKVLPGYTVQVRNLQTGELVGTTTSTAAGGYSFTGLVPANYAVELVDSSGAVVGSSASIAVGAGATSATAVALTASATSAAAAGAAGAAAAGGGMGSGLTTALIVTGIAASAGIVGAVVVVRDASPSR